MEKLDRAWMTPLLNRIADIAGEEAALILGRERAGQKLYIPASVTRDHWLASLVGMKAALAICTEMSGSHITLPQALSGDRRRRAVALAELIGKGYSNNQIARITGLSLATISRWRKRQPRQDTQLSLF